MVKYEFCSDDYLRQARVILARLAREHAAELGAETFSSCVVCTDPPAHLRLDGQALVFWTMSVGAARSLITRELRRDVDSVVTSDYQASLPRARHILSDTPSEEPSEFEPPHRTGDLSKFSVAMRTLLRRFHNEMAALTA